MKIKEPIYLTQKFKNKKEKIKKLSCVAGTPNKVSDLKNAFITGLE